VISSSSVFSFWHFLHYIHNTSCLNSSTQKHQQQRAAHRVALVYTLSYQKKTCCTFAVAVLAVAVSSGASSVADLKQVIKKQQL
jgi:hypothetical protein